ncbi:MAG: sugar-binding domain-containing protein, partial [Thermoguttaceae bacterium]
MPRPEYPRPQLRRDDWLNLNGKWRFRFDPQNLGLAEDWVAKTDQFDRRITVPFCWESRLSGIAETSGQKIGWYARTVTIPDAWKGRHVWLCFGAVDYEARVWVDGKPVGCHEGGYSPFGFDITEFASPGSSVRIVVRALDATDPELPLGKQGGRWFTPTSGIWQTVWLEARAASYLKQTHLVPRLRDGRWSLEVELEVAGADGPVEIEISSPDAGVKGISASLDLSGGQGRLNETLAVASPKPWSPAEPHLYDLDIRLRGADGQTDTVHTYFGLRTISREGYGELDRQVVLLNGRPIQLRGVLDQSFNPQGIYTAPDDDFIRRDMEIARSAGFNMLRIHVKADEPRRLYWADRLGMLIVQDMPCTMRQSPRAREAWQKTMEATIRRDRNHPSIIAWCLFNENWGLAGDKLTAGRQDDSEQDTAEQDTSELDTHQWVRRMFERVKNELDPWRLVEASTPGRYDREYSDFDSWQFAIEDFGWARESIEEAANDARDNGGPLLLNMRFSSLPPHGGDRDISWGFHYLLTQLRRHDTVGGYVYGQFSDVQWQHNGIVNYDRSAKEFGYNAFVPGMTAADLQGEDFVGFDALPLLEVNPGGQFVLPIFVSHFSDRSQQPTLRWRIVGEDSNGLSVSTDVKELPVNWHRYRTIVQKPLRGRVPGGPPFVGAVVLELVDEHGKQIAANFVNLIVRRMPPTEEDELALTAEQRRGLDYNPPVEVIAPRLVALRFDVSDFAALRTDEPAWEWIQGRDKIFIRGNGEVEYHLELPSFVRQALPTKIMLVAELATKSNGQQLDWPSVRRPDDYPQTQQRKFDGSISVRLFDQEIWRLKLPDDPCDTRGVLSRQGQYQPGSYGFLVRKRADLTQMVALRDNLSNRPFVPLVFRTGGEGHGLSIYGSR